MTRRETKDGVIESRGPAPPGRGELIAIAAVVLLAGALRFAYPSRMAVEHFDEGVYASNIWFGEASDYRYPARHLYAPPLLPAIIEWSIILFGVGPISVKLVSLLAGTAIVGVVWWVGRRWFGREAGMAAAVLAALSDVHIVYSRMALTDVLMCLWLLIAVGCVHEMLVRGRQGWAVAAGLATGLAWATKYNGWLPVAIAVSGFVFYALIAWWKSSETPPAWREFAISMLLMVVTAAVVWIPVWLDLQDRGGYAAVAANHRGYLVGLDGWLDSMRRQFGNHRYLEGWLGVTSMFGAIVAACVVQFREKQSRGFDGYGIAAALLLLPFAVAWIGVSLALGVLTVAALCAHLWRRSPVNPFPLPACLLAVWFGGLLLVTPLYHPYPRLTLPWLVSAWLGGGTAIGLLTRWITSEEGKEAVASRRRLSRWVLAVGCMVMVGFSTIAISLHLHRLQRPFVSGWQTQTGLKEIAARIIADVKSAAPPSDVLIQVYAEPALFFYLAAEGDSRLVTVPVGSLKPPGGPAMVTTYLVTGPHAHRESGYAAAIGGFGDRLEPVAEYGYRPSDVVQLNARAAGELRYSGAPEEQVRLYRVR